MRNERDKTKKKDRHHAVSYASGLQRGYLYMHGAIQPRYLSWPVYNRADFHPGFNHPTMHG